MAHKGRPSKVKRPDRICFLCREPITTWPRNACILANETGTEERMFHFKCAEIFIRRHGAKIVGDNVGKG
jgi:hypothetical protein